MDIFTHEVDAMSEAPDRKGRDPRATITMLCSVALLLVQPLPVLAGTTTASATAQPATQEQVRQFLLPAAMTGSPAKLPARLGKLRLAKAMGSTSNADGTVTLL